MLYGETGHELLYLMLYSGERLGAPASAGMLGNPG